MTNSWNPDKILSRSAPIVIATLVMANLAMGQARASSVCSQWIDKVAEGRQAANGKLSKPERGAESAGPVPSADPWGVSFLGESEKLEIIRCLLEAENDLSPAAFGGAMRLDVSQTFAMPRANLAALYAIDYIYEGRFDHANAVALRGKNASYTDRSGNYVTRSAAVHKAYQYYRSWFEKVRRRGLMRSKESGLRPLDGSGLSWY